MGFLWLDDKREWKHTSTTLAILAFLGLAWWGLVELVLWLIPVIRAAIWG